MGGGTSTGEKPGVICFPIHPTSWPTMFKIALSIKEAGKYTPVILLTDTVLPNLSLCKQEEIKAITLSSDDLVFPEVAVTSDSPISAKRKHVLFRSLLFQYGKRGYRFVQKKLEKLEECSARKVFSISMYTLFRAACEVVYIRVYQTKVKAVLDNVKPVAIFLYSDNLGGVFASLAKECLKRKIKIIVPPAAFQHPDIPASRRAHLPFLRVSCLGAPLINNIIKNRFPEQFYIYQKREVLFYFPHEILAMSFLNILPPSPWKRGGNFSNVVCVEDYYQKEVSVKSGIDENKIAVVSHIDCDNLWMAKTKVTKEKVYSEYGFNKEKKLIVLALPHLMEEGYAKTWDEHWHEMEFLVSRASKTGHNILLALHPKMDKGRYGYLEKNFPCKINRKSTSDIVPFADVYVSAGSSTTFWAIACNVPVVDVWNFYESDSNFFSYLTSLTILKKREEYAPMLWQFLNDAPFYIQKKKHAEEENRRFLVPLDGNNHMRLLTLIDHANHNVK